MADQSGRRKFSWLRSNQTPVNTSLTKNLSQKTIFLKGITNSNPPKGNTFASPKSPQNIIDSNKPNIFNSQDQENSKSSKDNETLNFSQHKMAELTALKQRIQSFSKQEPSPKISLKPKTSQPISNLNQPEDTIKRPKESIKSSNKRTYLTSSNSPAWHDTQTQPQPKARAVQRPHQLPILSTSSVDFDSPLTLEEILKQKNDQKIKSLNSESTSLKPKDSTSLSRIDVKKVAQISSNIKLIDFDKTEFSEQNSTDATINSPTTSTQPMIEATISKQIDSLAETSSNKSNILSPSSLGILSHSNVNSFSSSTSSLDNSFIQSELNITSQEKTSSDIVFQSSNKIVSEGQEITDKESLLEKFTSKDISNQNIETSFNSYQLETTITNSNKLEKDITQKISHSSHPISTETTFDSFLSNNNKSNSSNTNSFSSEKLPVIINSASLTNERHSKILMNLLSSSSNPVWLDENQSLQLNSESSPPESINSLAQKSELQLLEIIKSAKGINLDENLTQILSSNNDESQSSDTSKPHLNYPKSKDLENKSQDEVSAILDSFCDVQEKFLETLHQIYFKSTGTSLGVNV